MAFISRVGDIGMGRCPAHKSTKSYTTIFTVGSPNVFVNGRPCAIVGTVGMASCGHPTIALTGASIGFVNGSPIHRVGDTGTNPGAYTTMVGSGNSFSN